MAQGRALSSKIACDAACSQQSALDDRAGSPKSSTKNVDNFVGNVSSDRKNSAFTGFLLDCLKIKLIKIQINQ